MLKIGVLVSGGGTNLQAVIDGIKSGIIKNAEITTVISNKKNAYALARAKMNGIDSICIDNKEFEDNIKYCETLIKYLENRNVDLIVLAGFLVMLDEIIIKRFNNRIINVHPSLIPSFCGKGFYGIKVHEKALEKGVKITGATVHIVNNGVDEGPIINQRAVAVQDDDTPNTLQMRVMEKAEHVILPEAINLIANNKLEIKDGIVRRLT